MQSFAPFGDQIIDASAITTAVSANKGQVTCVRFTQGCTLTSATKLGFRHITGTLLASCQVGIYNSAGTAPIRVGAIDDCSGAGANHADTGLTAYTLTAGTAYLACWASNATATLTMVGVGASSNTLVFNSLNDTFYLGPTAAASVAQFNNGCTANVTPYACCTGNLTGTCTGLPSNLGTLTVNTATTASGPIIGSST